MILFNTLKKAQHYVKYCQKNRDRRRDGYEWSITETFIDGNLVLQRSSGDGCGCGCDMYYYTNVYVLGRIKVHDIKSERDNKLKKILQAAETLI